VIDTAMPFPIAATVPGVSHRAAAVLVNSPAHARTAARSMAPADPAEPPVISVR
jgi:hypothetical protein